MNGPYRTAACVDAAAEQHTCSPALCCACPTCRTTSELLAKWLASQADPAPPARLGSRASRVAGTVVGVVAVALFVATGIAAGRGMGMRHARDLQASQSAAQRQIADLQSDVRGLEQRFTEAQSARRAAEKRAAELAADRESEQPTSRDTSFAADRDRHARDSSGDRRHHGRGDREGHSLLRDAEKRFLPWPAALLGHSGTESHDPDVLLGRALRLVQAGLDLKIERTTLSPAELSEAVGGGSWPVVPFIRNDQVLGFTIDPADEAGAARLRRIGIAKGDLVTAVNGHRVTSPDTALEVYSQVRDRQKAILEIIRDQRRVVLLVQIR